MHLKLGVNIDHVATLRQARYALLPESPNAEPSPMMAAKASKCAGADSITIHVRGDRRHMQTQDAYELRDWGGLPINLEMGNTSEMLNLALDLAPKYVCLVPETREEVTTEGGLAVAGYEEALRPTISKLQGAGIEVSLFIDPEANELHAAASLGVEMVELHTGEFSNAFGADREREVQRLAEAAELGASLGLQVNAGHGINYKNLADILVVPHLAELNIGHSIVARSVEVGFRTAVEEMITAMSSYQGGAK